MSKRNSNTATDGKNYHTGRHDSSAQAALGCVQWS
jgi:hypothetical protein